MAMRTGKWVVLTSLPICALAAAAIALQPPERGALEVKRISEALDNIAQPRFLDFSDGRFGPERLVRVSGHDNVRFRPESSREKELFAKAAEPRRDFCVLFMHCSHVPATAFYRAGIHVVPAEKRVGKDLYKATKPEDRRLAMPLLRYVDGKEFGPREKGNGFATAERNIAEWQRIVDGRLGALKAGKSQTAESADWTLVMRPVRASQEACLKCHTESKRGDTLGVMVYAVSATKPANNDRT